MTINHLILGVYQTNCYILRADADAVDCLIIDTGLETRPLERLLEENVLNPFAVILTHGHVDHIAALNDLREEYPDMKVYIHQLDAEMLIGSEANLWIMAMKPFSTDPPDFVVRDGDKIEAVGIKLDVLHTPGHTPGGICLYSSNQAVVFSGDTLFADSIGRTDMPGGDMSQLVASIKNILFNLPENTIVYPGHGPSTTIGHEKANNPFLR